MSHLKHWVKTVMFRQTTISIWVLSARVVREPAIWSAVTMARFRALEEYSCKADSRSRGIWLWLLAGTAGKHRWPMELAQGIRPGTCKHSDSGLRYWQGWGCGFHLGPGTRIWNKFAPKLICSITLIPWLWCAGRLVQRLLNLSDYVAVYKRRSIWFYCDEPTFGG